jgi:geranylgeranyl reductase family protein
MIPDLVPFHWQHATASAARDDWDVVIAGAGPSGAVAALHLAGRGHRVLLLDKQRFPRDKTCGDALLADALGVLERACLLQEVQQLGYSLRQASVFSPSGIECEVPGRYLVLRRRVLDAVIARRAVERGAHFCQGEVEALSLAYDGRIACTLAGAGGVCRARVAVVATGANTALLQRLGIVTARKPTGAAVRCYVRSTSGLDRLVVAYDRATAPGYAWIFPLGNQEYNVGCALFCRGDAPPVASLRATFQKFGHAFPLARALLDGGGPISPLVGGTLRCGLRGASSAHHNRLLAIGETIGATLPSTGEGIGKAMETAELAAEVIHEALRAGDLTRLQQFPARLEERFGALYRGYTKAQRWLARPWLNDLVAWRGGRSTFYRRALSGIVNETMSPRVAFSLGGILMSFVK